MDADFWHQRWENRHIGFDQARPNTLLVKYFGQLDLKKGSRVFVPLTGKTIDVAWLLSQGFKVVGAELNEIAVQELFEMLNLEPEVSDLGDLKLYHAPDIHLFVGDIFQLNAETLKKVNAIYDRAALVALPYKMRKDYTSHLIKITNQAPQLLIVFEYDQSQMPGPPFSVSEKEIQEHYSDAYEVALLQDFPIPGGLKGKAVASEIAWLLGGK